MRSRERADGQRLGTASLCPDPAGSRPPIVLCHEDLSGLFRRLLGRSAIGGTCLLASVMAALSIPGSTMPGPQVLGLAFLFGCVTAARGKSRMRDDLWEFHPAEDSVLLGLPWIILGLAVAGVSPAALWTAVWVCITVRLLPTAQEAGMLGAAREALTREGVPASTLPPGPTVGLPSGKELRARPLVKGLVIERVEAGDAPCCPVCSGGLSGQTLRCSSCDTAHHAECFHYNGRCGRFACGGTAVAGPRPLNLGRSAASVSRNFAD